MNDRFKFRIVRGKSFAPFGSVGTILNNVSLGAEFGIGEDDIIEQCTGLKDKNGNLIYEGDVIKDEFYRRFTIVWSEEDCVFEGRVIYRDPEYSDRFDLYKGATDNCEIIGNIHEQAEQKEVK